MRYDALDDSVTLLKIRLLLAKSTCCIFMHNRGATNSTDIGGIGCRCGFLSQQSTSLPLENDFRWRHGVPFDGVMR